MTNVYKGFEGVGFLILASLTAWWRPDGTGQWLALLVAAAKLGFAN